MTLLHNSTVHLVLFAKINMSPSQLGELNACVTDVKGRLSCFGRFTFLQFVASPVFLIRQRLQNFNKYKSTLLYKYGGRKFTWPPSSGNWLFKGHSLSVATKLRVSVKALHLRSMLWSGSSEDGSLFGICRTRGLNWGHSWFNMIFQVIKIRMLLLGSS